MSKNKSKAAMLTPEESESYQSEDYSSSEQDSQSSNGQDQMTPTKTKKRKREALKPNKVMCPFCPHKELTFISIKKHLKQFHLKQFIPYESKSRRWWANYTPGQTTLVKKDPETDALVNRFLSNSIPEASKRPKTIQEETAFDTNSFEQKLQEAFTGHSQGFSQDEMTLTFILIDIMQDLDSVSAQLFLQSSAARQNDSHIRKVLESGIQGITDLELSQVAKLLFAAILIKGSTLELFKGILKNFTVTKQSTIRSYLESMLESQLGFSSTYSEWLAKSLHLLNSNSFILLEKKGKDSESLVRLSLVTHLTLDADYRKLTQCQTIIDQWFPKEKQQLIFKGIQTTKEVGDLISLTELTNIIMIIKKLPKLDTNFNTTIQGMTMKKWAQYLKSDKEKQIFFDEKSLAEASQTIIDRYIEDLKHCESDILFQGETINRLLEESEFKLNYVQLATALIAAQHVKAQKNQLWVVPAGQGKSRIHAGLTLALLKCTKHNVYVVFQNERLMNRDMKQNQRLINFADGIGFEWRKRVKYQITSKLDTKTKKGVMILDEADTIILKDLEGFMTNTNYKNLNVIGLTATAYGGKSTGIEANALEMMGYKIYKNNIAAKVEEPEIHVRVKLGELAQWQKTIEQHREKQPVLIYATGQHYLDICSIEYVQPITQETDQGCLEKMNEKKEGFYPVYIMTLEMGDRGENYRAPDHPLGIALLIASTFPDARTRIQTLWRVERYNDKAWRIQDTTFDEIDLDLASQKKAFIQKQCNKFSFALGKAQRPAYLAEQAKQAQAVEERKQEEKQDE